MDNVVPLVAAGNPSPVFTEKTAAQRLVTPLELAERERVTWLAFRTRRRAFRKTRTLADEIAMLEARNAWNRSFRQIERDEAAA